MVRTQIQLTKEQTVTLRKLAASRGVSVAKLIRQGIDLYLRQSGSTNEHVKRRRALSFAGGFGSGKRDLAVRHDQYLAETYAQ